MKPFSFVHAADLHLGYSQYGLETRREDFDKVFQELVDKTVELNPDFLIIAGDLFHHARPSNVVLESAIRNFSRLRDADIPVLTVDGSHDSSPNIVTGTILSPLDSAGLIYHLPKHEGACWRKSDCCYVYGIPNFRTRHRTEERLPDFLDRNKPAPDSSLFNIFVLHMTVDVQGLKPPYMEAEIPPELVPEGFDYYAAGHIHERYAGNFKTGLLVYSGCVETVDYAEAQNPKGFYHVNVEADGKACTQFVSLVSPRKFIVLEQDYTGLTPSKIVNRVRQVVNEADEEGVILVPVLKGVLPAGARRSDIDISQIRSAAEKALLIHPIVSLRESEVSAEIVRSIFESEFKDIKTKSFEYFLQIFSDRYGHDEAEKIATAAVSLIEPLVRKDEKKVKQILEELVQ